MKHVAAQGPEITACFCGPLVAKWRVAREKGLGRNFVRWLYYVVLTQRLSLISGPLEKESPVISTDQLSKLFTEVIMCWKCLIWIYFRNREMFKNFKLISNHLIDCFLNNENVFFIYSILLYCLCDWVSVNIDQYDVTMVRWKCFDLFYDFFTFLCILLSSFTNKKKNHSIFFPAVSCSHLFIIFSLHSLSAHEHLSLPNTSPA